MRRILGGVSSGIITMLFTYPIDVIRIRLSTDMSKFTEERVYKGFNHCLKTMVKNEGFKGLYRGYFLSTLGLAPYLGIAFTAYDTLKNYLPRKENEDNLLKVAIGYLGVGSVSGMLAQFLTHPLDTVR